jgi:hypothetical protein
MCFVLEMLMLKNLFPNKPHKQLKIIYNLQKSAKHLKALN